MSSDREAGGMAAWSTDNDLRNGSGLDGRPVESVSARRPPVYIPSAPVAQPPGRCSGPTYDPTYPRHLKEPQADSRRFYEALEALIAEAIEATLNSRVTGWECPACGTWTYGDPTACGRCGKRRGTK